MSNKNTKVNANSKETKPAIKVIDAKKFYEGSVFTNFYGERFIVDKYNNKNDVDVHFLDEHQYSCKTYRSVLVSGNLKNPYHPDQHGGYCGVGIYGRKNDVMVYRVWYHMLERTDPKFRKGNINMPSLETAYKNVTVCDEWRNFQIFAQWYYDYINKLNPKYKYDLDKDILQWGYESKIYSPNTACLVPREINNDLISSWYSHNNGNLPVGVSFSGYKFSAVFRVKKDVRYLGVYDTPEDAFAAYKKAKEDYIKERALFYLNEGAILPYVYDALCKIDIKPFKKDYL